MTLNYSSDVNIYDKTLLCCTDALVLSCLKNIWNAAIYLFIFLFVFKFNKFVISLIVLNNLHFSVNENDGD